jgi:hypothetical protein
LRNPIQTVTYDWAFMPVVAIRNILLLSFTLRAILSAGPLRSRRSVAAPPAVAPEALEQMAAQDDI